MFINTNQKYWDQCRQVEGDTRIEYRIYKNGLNSDYRLKHNPTYHQDFVKSNKNIP